jgi:DNA-binding NarL/FixJ family response regulator
VIRLLLAEDHPVVRAGLERLLANEADIDIVGAAANGREAVELALELQPDVVLMDISMPVMDGVEATRRITEVKGNAVRVVILTSFSDRTEIIAALDSGASGYLLKDAEPEELLAGVRAAARGDSPLAPRAAREVLSARTDDRPASELSARETDVLRLVAQGLPNKRIARELEISEKTVKAHLTHVFQQIDVTDRTQAALWAQRNGVGGPG